jgi:hypothetical protein
MCQTLVEQQKAVEMYLTRWDKQALNLEPKEWATVNKIVGLLDPIESASMQMCRADEPISIQFPIARALTADVHAISDPELLAIRASFLGLIIEKFDVEYSKYALLLLCTHDVIIFMFLHLEFMVWLCFLIRASRTELLQIKWISEPKSCYGSMRSVDKKWMSQS